MLEEGFTGEEPVHMVGTGEGASAEVGEVLQLPSAPLLVQSQIPAAKERSVAL